VIRAVRTVKLNNWEPYFQQRIHSIRQKELHYLKARKYLDAGCVYLWASAPLLITLAILVTYTGVMGDRLTAAKVFTSLALVQILIVPLNAFPWVLNALVEAWISKRRFDSFFGLQSVDPLSIYSLTRREENLLELDGASFSWSDPTEEGGGSGGGFATRGLTLEGRRGMVLGVVGPVGSGKSTMLMGILGECHIESARGGMQMGTPVRIRQQAINEG
jgi:ATP-binding cassette, subfamily C (CFTR/MRP), member 10